MADGQISFYHLNSADASSFNKEGAIVISKRDAEKHYADIFVDLNNTRWKIKPEYSWEEEVEGIQAYIDAAIKRQMINTEQELLLKYFRVKRTTDEETKDVTLDIWTMSGDDVITQDGELLTTASLKDLITESAQNGTFLVADNPVKIHGLDTAAYTPVEDYTPMEVSIWTDLESDENG